MNNLAPAEIWYVTGSQTLYGEAVLKKVAINSRKIVAELNQHLPVKLVFQPVLTSSDAIRQLCLDANNSPKCACLILWMHTFSPSKMWIAGLSALIVVLASLAVERTGPVIGALIATLPVAGGPAYVFLAMEHGPEFIAAGTLMGPLVTPQAVDDMMAAIDAAKAQGGQVLCGGHRRPDIGPQHVEPTIIKMPAQTDIVQAETFAPILYLLEYTDFADALALHNGVPQGLSSAIFTESKIGRAHV